MTDELLCMILTILLHIYRQILNRVINTNTSAPALGPGGVQCKMLAQPFFCMFGQQILGESKEAVEGF